MRKKQSNLFSFLFYICIYGEKFLIPIDLVLLNIQSSSFERECKKFAQLLQTNERFTQALLEWESEILWKVIFVDCLAIVEDNGLLTGSFKFRWEDDSRFCEQLSSSMFSQC